MRSRMGNISRKRALTIPDGKNQPTKISEPNAKLTIIIKPYGFNPRGEEEEARKYRK